MFEDQLRRRLQRWGDWQRTLRRPSPKKNLPRTSSFTRGSPSARTHRVPAPPLTTLDTSSRLDRGREITNEAGRYWLIERPLSDVCQLGPTGGNTNDSARGQSPEPKDAMLESLQKFRSCFPRTTLFLDLETCGFAGAAIFLTGLIRCHEGQLQLAQLWARNYAEEAAMILGVKNLLDQVDVLVTFNGKSFDWPQVRDRMTLHAGAATSTAEPMHFDLLHHARRTFGKRFGDCRLQTLEQHICGRLRRGDIPGSQIPGVYAEYVRTGRSELVDSILHHNALDLVTLLELAVHISGVKPS